MYKGAKQLRTTAGKTVRAKKRPHLPSRQVGTGLQSRFARLHSVPAGRVFSFVANTSHQESRHSGLKTAGHKKRENGGMQKKHSCRNFPPENGGQAFLLHTLCEIVRTRCKKKETPWR
jgi:hypothetical protein